MDDRDEFAVDFHREELTFNVRRKRYVGTCSNCPESTADFNAARILELLSSKPWISEKNKMRCLH